MVRGYGTTAPASRPMPSQSSFRRIDLNAWLIPLIWFAGAATLLTRFVINCAGFTATKASHFGDGRRATRGMRAVRTARPAVAKPCDWCARTWGIVRPIILVRLFRRVAEESRDAVIPTNWRPFRPTTF